MRTYDLCRQKKNRLAFAKEVLALADRIGVEAKISEPGLNEREVSVYMKLGQYAVGMHFNGELRSHAFLGHWHTDCSAPNWRDLAVYPKNFDYMIGVAPHAAGSMNRHHYGKATTYADTFEGLLASLEAGFAALKPLAGQTAVAVAVAQAA